MVTRAPPWTDKDDVVLRRLAERGYTVTRLCIAMKRPAGVLKARAKALGISLKKPQRLPSSERGLGTAEMVNAGRRSPAG
jgi:hypothetical protein